MNRMDLNVAAIPHIWEDKMAQLTPKEVQTLERIKKTQAEIELRSRNPFIEILAAGLLNSPSNKAVKKLADKSPDRYAQYITQMAKLSGYSEKIEVEQSKVNLKQLAMSELRSLLSDLSSQLKAIDVTPQPIDAAPALGSTAPPTDLIGSAGVETIGSAAPLTDIDPK